MTNPPRGELPGVLGLAHRAGQVVRGTDSVRRALRDGQLHLVLLARDAASAQRSKLTGLISGSETPTRVVGTRVELGVAVGAGPLSAVGVTDRGFAEKIDKALQVDATLAQ